MMSESDCDYGCESDSDVMDSVRKRQLVNQIADLQHAVTEMKSAFKAAVQQLSSVQIDDQGGLAERVEENKVECQSNVSEVLKLMLSMRAEFASLKNRVHSSCEAQHDLHLRVQMLTWERDLLVEELYKSGSISDQMRYRIQNSRALGRASSGSHSNDSGVVLVTEKGPTPSSDGLSHPCPMSMPYRPPNLISPHVHDYVASLEFNLNGYLGDEVSVHAYDSDSSVVNAAVKSISLSTSLGKQCGLQLDSCEVGSDDDGDDDDDDHNDGLSRSGSLKKHIADLSPGDERLLGGSGPDGMLLETTRQLVLTEILDTERRYCRSLCTLHDTFAVPLKRSGILSSKDINTLFPEEVFHLYGKHCILLSSLTERLRSWGRHATVGDVFDSFTDPNQSGVLQLYTSYVDDFPEVLKTFHKLCQRCPKFARFLKSRLFRPACGGSDLGVFLVTPVQRIPHYVLLLKRMLRLTSERHPDHSLLSDCLARLKDFMDRLNDTMEHSFQLITAQIQPEDEQKLRTLRNTKTRSKQDLRANSSSHSDQLDFGLPSSKEPPIAKDGGIQDGGCQQQQNQQQQQQEEMQQQQKHHAGEKNFRRLSQSNVRSPFPCVIGPLRTRSRSESLVSSISSNSEDHFGDWNGRHVQEPRKQQQQHQQRFYRKKESYYWHDDVEFRCESGPNSVSTEDDSNDAQLRHISEDDSGTEDDDDDDEDDARDRSSCNETVKLRSAPSMQDVKKRDECSSEPNLVAETNVVGGGVSVLKCCQQHPTATVARGVSLACISPTDKRIRAKLMMQHSGRRPLDKSQSAHNLVKAEQICDCSMAFAASSSCSSSSSSSSSSTKTKVQVTKKRNFIRTSLKNILLFKKRNRKCETAKHLTEVAEKPCGVEPAPPKPSSANDSIHEADSQQGCCCRRPTSRSSVTDDNGMGAIGAGSYHCRCGKSLRF